MRAEKGFSNLVLGFVAVLLLGSVAFIGISPINLNAAAPSAPNSIEMIGEENVEFDLITCPAVVNIDPEDTTGDRSPQMKFDLTSVPAWVDIHYAKFWYYSEPCVIWSYDEPVYYMKVDDQAWTSDITPAEFDAQTVTYINNSTAGDLLTSGWHSIDITAQFNADYFMGYNYTSIRLAPRSSGWITSSISPHPTMFENGASGTKVWIARSYNPYLEIAYTPTVEYLIITRPMFVDALELLENLKKQRMSAKVMTVEEIVASYPGRDIPEQIRNCIKDYYENHGTQWVLLAGDVDPDDDTTGGILDKSWEVPIKYSGDIKYTDYYYAGLDKTWDNYDEIDWEANVYVGRFPARDASTMQAIVDKTVRYETNPPRKFGEVCLFGTSDFDTGLWPGIKDRYIPHEVSTHEFYEWDNNSFEFCYEINEHNPVLVGASGHGTPSGISLGGGGTLVDLGAPINLNNRGFLMYAWSCYTNAFVGSDTCLGEAMLQDPDGGAVGYVGYMGMAWEGNWTPTASLFEEIFWNKEYHQGAIVYKSAIKYTGGRKLEHVLGRLLLGDPELKIVAPVLVSISPGHGSGLPGTTFTYTVTVQNMGNREETYTLTATDNAGWNPGISPSTLTVPADKNRTATLSVTVPSDAPIGAEDKITVTATSTENAEASDNASSIAHAGLRMVIYPSADVCTYTQDPGTYHRTQLKFDISNTLDMSVVSAKLWLYRYNEWGLGDWDGGVTVNRVDDQTWDESITAGQFNAQFLTDQQNHGGKWMSDDWDFVAVLDQLKVDRNAGDAYTSLRLRWADDDGTQPIPGCGDDTWLDIGSSYSNEPIIRFYSSEYSDPAYHPYLEIIYVLRGVEVSISPSSQSGTPGGWLSYTVTIANTGDVEDTYDLSASDTEGWVIKTMEAGASEDSAVRSGYPDESFGDDYQYAIVTSSQISRIYQKYQVPSFSGELASAKVYLYCHTAYDNFSIEVCRVENDDWLENEITWNNQPSFGPPEDSVLVDGEGWCSWDVTSWVDNQLRVDNVVSLVFKAEDENSEYAANYFYSREHNSERPYLELTFSRAISSPTLTVPPGENRTATLTVTIPGGATLGTEDNITVTATSQADPSVSDNASCIIIVGVIYSSGDAHVNKDNPTQNYGDSSELWVRKDQGAEVERAYLKFDLSTLPPNILVTSAVFKIYGISGNSTLAKHLYAVENDGWQEETICWDNKPGLNTMLEYDIGHTGWRSADVTTFVEEQREVDNVVSLAIVHKVWGLGVGYAHYYSMESSNPPHLEIAYVRDPLWAGTASFKLRNLYKVGLETDLQLLAGSKLVVKFYNCWGAFQGENVVWSGSTPDTVSFPLKDVPHPQGKEAVQKAELALTTDNTEDVISTLSTFIVRKVDLESRFMEIPMEWMMVDSAGKIQLEMEFMSLPLYWMGAPS